MNLNKKGYMLVEIIIASVLAMSIAYYLLNLTYKFKDTNSDIYQSYYYTKDKLLITKNIMSDIERGTILEVRIPEFTDNSQKIEFNLHINGVTEKRRLEATKNGSNTVIKYGKITPVTIDGTTTNVYDPTDISYYEKTLEKSLVIGKIELEEINDATLILLPISSIYDNKDYSVKLIGHKEYRIDVDIKSAPTDNSLEWVTHYWGYDKNHNTPIGKVSETSGQDIRFSIEANDKVILNKGHDTCTYLLYGTEIIITELLYKNASGEMVPISNYNNTNRIKIILEDDTKLTIFVNDSDRNNIKYIEKKENEGLVHKYEAGYVKDSCK